MCAVFIVECTQARRRPLRLVNVKSLHLVPLHLLLHSIYGDLIMYRPHGTVPSQDSPYNLLGISIIRYPN